VSDPMWRLLASVTYDPDVPGRKEYLPSRAERWCRFCTSAPHLLTFKKDAHAIPEALGNRYLLSREECDACNASAAQLEDDLAKHLTVARVMSRIPGKGGDVKHRLGERPSFILSDAAKNQIIVDRTVGDDSIETRRISTGVKWRIRIPGYRPLNVAKALARIVLMLVPETELPRLEHVRRWTRDEVVWDGVVFDEGFIPGTGLAKVRVAVEGRVQARPGEANYRLALIYGTAAFSFHLPGPDMLLTNVPMPPKARSPYPPHDVKWRRIRPSDGVYRGRVDEVDLFVPALAAMPPPLEREIATSAYYRWLDRGAPTSAEGALQDWLEAEQDLLWGQVEIAAIRKPRDELLAPDMTSGSSASSR
jgi:hypothetical protein